MSKTKRLSHVEEIELTRKLNSLEVGSRQYRRCLDTIVTHNLGLVNKIVSKFPLKNATCNFDDLFQEGVAGLIHGIRKFDPSKGYRLSTYVYNWISVYVRRYYQNHGRTVRIPVHMADKQFKLNRQIEELTESLGRTPTIEEIRGLNQNADKILTATRQTTSLNRTIGEDSELESVIGEDRTEEFQLKHDAGVLLAKLRKDVSDRDFNVIVKRFGLDGGEALSLAEVAEEYQVTRARVHQIEKKLLVKLRELAA
jgi:RNA polymerase sigma factor (sigma-70 family)